MSSLDANTDTETFAPLIYCDIDHALLQAIRASYFNLSMSWAFIWQFASLIFDYKQKTCLSRRDTVLQNRLRIGHTRLTHSYLLSGDDVPECGTCQWPLKLHTHTLSWHIVYYCNGAQWNEQFLQVDWLNRALILLRLPLSSKRFCIFRQTI